MPQVPTWYLILPLEQCAEMISDSESVRAKGEVYTLQLLIHRVKRCRVVVGDWTGAWA